MISCRPPRPLSYPVCMKKKKKKKKKKPLKRRRIKVQGRNIIRKALKKRGRTMEMKNWRLQMENESIIKANEKLRQKALLLRQENQALLLSLLQTTKVKLLLPPSSSISIQQKVQPNQV